MRYKIFLLAFIVSFISGVTAFVVYLRAIFSFMTYMSRNHNPEMAPFEFFSILFSPQFIIALVVMLAAGLTYRIIGIVWVAKNKIISAGEKAIWIVGFVLFGFVTAIVFLILAKSRKLIETDGETTS